MVTFFKEQMVVDLYMNSDLYILNYLKSFMDDLIFLYTFFYEVLFQHLKNHFIFIYLLVIFMNYNYFDLWYHNICILNLAFFYLYLNLVQFFLKKYCLKLFHFLKIIDRLEIRYLFFNSKLDDLVTCKPFFDFSLLFL
jgi:hypothetical protein